MRNKKIFDNPPTNLRVYNDSDELADDVFFTVRRLLGTFEFGDLSEQAMRSADSVPSNLAEGAGRTQPQFRHYVGTARGSCQELVGQLKRLHRRTGDSRFRKLQSRAQKLQYRIYRLEKAILKRMEESQVSEEAQIGEPKANQIGEQREPNR